MSGDVSSESGEIVMRRVGWNILALVIVSLSFGCSAMKPGRLDSVSATTDTPRAGNVFLLRGFIGVFSTGIDTLGEKLVEQGVNAQVFQEVQSDHLALRLRTVYKDGRPEPLVLVGHSYGADQVIAMARRLNAAGIKVDLIVTLDPVMPARVPGNVTAVYNLYQSNGAWDTLPWLRGIPLKADEPGPLVLRNYDIRTERTDLLEPGLDHFNIEKLPKIQGEVIARVLEVCPPRTKWVQSQQKRVEVASSSSANGPTGSITLNSSPTAARP
jgi:hypothetical protein